jgi:hypothetical protein
MRYTFPALITSTIKLCRRYKQREETVSLDVHVAEKIPTPF